jgi:hypothetical protein
LFLPLLKPPPKQARVDRFGPPKKFGGVMPPSRGRAQSHVRSTCLFTLLRSNAAPRTQRRLLRAWLLTQGFQAWEEVAALLPRILAVLLDVTENLAETNDTAFLGLERGLRYVLAVALEATPDDPQEPLIQRLNAWLRIAKRSTESRRQDDPLTINGPTGQIGRFSYRLVSSMGLPALPGMAVSLVSHYRCTAAPLCGPACRNSSCAAHDEQRGKSAATVSASGPPPVNTSAKIANRMPAHPFGPTRSRKQVTPTRTGFITASG